jgi:hypothetical protein
MATRFSISASAPESPLAPGVLLPHRLVALEHLSRETPDDGALGGIVFEAFGYDEVETPAVSFPLREGKALLGTG